MKLLQINVTANWGSTGKIAEQVGLCAQAHGWESYLAYGRDSNLSQNKLIKIGSGVDVLEHFAENVIIGNEGLASRNATKKFLKQIENINPDLIHLHNIHGYYINYKVLFDYLKNEFQGRVFWTLHDCLPMTGHCAYFSNVSCEKWKTECHDCPNKKMYPTSLIFDRSRKNYQEKKILFNGVKDLTIITPSIWLQNIVASSYLKNYPVKTINNGIDLNIFYPRLIESIFDKYNIPKDKKVLLGVASIWEERKGLDDFLMLSKLIKDDYVIVLVGLNDKQINKLKQYKNIIGIKRTENQDDLASLYSLSYVLINPTYEDNYPTVNIEALASGTRVIAYDTGGCVEQATNPNMYIVKKTTKNNNVKNIIELLEIMDEHQDFDTSIYSDKLFTKKMLDEYRK